MENEKAVDAFLTAKAQIDYLLARLTELSSDHFYTDPDEIDYGHVGTITRYRDALQTIVNSAFREGEFSA